MMIGQLKALVAAAVFLSAKLVASAPASAVSLLLSPIPTQFGHPQESSYLHIWIQETPPPPLGIKTPLGRVNR
jgi:hypothetical protein